MLETYFYTFVSVLSISFISFVGVFTLAMRDDLVRKYISIFISVAVGALLGDSFIHLIPETFESFGNTILPSLLIIFGILLFFVMEKFLHWHHHGEDWGNGHVHPVGRLVLLSDAIHNFIDGIVIAASFLISVPVGLATAIAVIIHEIPQEIGDFSVLLHSGYTKTRALWLNFLSAVSAILGATILLLVSEKAEALVPWFVPLAAGGFIYIAMADLVPELQKTQGGKSSIAQIFAVIAGVLAMFALVYLE